MGEGEGVDYSVLDAKDPESLTEKEKKARRRCRPAATTSCTSSPFPGNSSLPLFLPQRSTEAIPLLLSPLPPLAFARPLLAMWLVTWAASSTSRTLSMPSLSLLLAPQCRTPLPQRQPPLRTRLPTPLWAT